MDGTADFTYYLSALQNEAHSGKLTVKENTFSYGAIVRGNSREKNISLVFSGHDFADGLHFVIKTLKSHGVNGAFFLTGNFYRNHRFSSMIKKLLKEGHYLGAHSDKHLLYCTWENRDSLLIKKNEFVNDIRNNYKTMADFEIEAGKARWFLPPYEWYNDSIAEWSRQYGLQLINFTPGIKSNQDWTYPSPEIKYYSSDSIYNSILEYEKVSVNGLNGFIMLIHFGTDPRRTDKFYNRLDDLITDIKGKGYRFVSLDELLN
jgi:peptidoglycan/xylan/chitin deacetylase (PgdA/CDA1 family)